MHEGVVSVAALLSWTALTSTAHASLHCRGEPLGLLGFAGCGISLLGMVVLVHPPMIFGGHAQWGPRRVWGTGFGLFSAICCAGAFISIR
jgi:drug/metabolite transporter (DMT)-like permease